jgi:hypothetical protein
MILTLVAATGCSIKHLKVPAVTLCQGRGQCAPATDPGRELLPKLYDLLLRAKGSEVALYRSDPENHYKGGNGVHLFVQGGPIPGWATAYALKVTDVSPFDTEKQEIRVKFGYKGRWFLSPFRLLCASGEGVFSVVSPTEVRMHSSSACTWLMFPSIVTIDWLIDYMDFDQGLLGAHYQIGGGGIPIWRRGTGYLLADLGATAAATGIPPK